MMDIHCFTGCKMLPQILSHLIFFILLWAGIIIPILCMRKLKLWEVKWLVFGQRACKWQSWNEKPGLLPSSPWSCPPSPRYHSPIILLFVSKEFLENQSWDHGDSSLSCKWTCITSICKYFLISLQLVFGYIIQIWGIQIIGRTAGSPQGQIHDKEGRIWHFSVISKRVVFLI